LIYNLGLALPVLLLGGIIALGMSPAQVDLFREKHRVAIRLITGFTLIALAALIYRQLI
jgi:cytochrome c biogenesis protein CcdA